jgi:DNA-binding MarR family transcriptional regulator
VAAKPPLPIDPIEEAARQWHAHGWSEAAAGMAAVTSIMRAQAIVLARVDDVLRPLSLTFARYELLMLLHFSRTGSLPMVKASARLQVHPASVTNVATRLERAGLVRRRAHPTDGRAILVEIT